MFSTVIGTPYCSVSRATPSTKAAAYSFCQRNGGCATTAPDPRSTAICSERSSFSQGSLPQTRWVTSKVGA